MIALIPVAGYATRLYPLTENAPKALLEVGGKPMLEHVFQKLEELPQIEKAVIISNHRFFSHFQEWAKKFQTKTKIPLTVLDDGTGSNETRLGAIGDAQFAVQKEKIDSEIVWVSGDNLFTFSLRGMHAEFAEKKQDLIGCFDVQSFEEAKKMGIVELDSRKKVIGFVEKPAEPKSTFCSVGIYFYTRETVRLFRTYLQAGNSPDKPGEFVQWLYREKPVFGFVFNHPSDQWFDIGTLEVLESVRKSFQS